MYEYRTNYLKSLPSVLTHVLVTMCTVRPGLVWLFSLGQWYGEEQLIKPNSEQLF